MTTAWPQQPLPARGQGAAAGVAKHMGRAAFHAFLQFQGTHVLTIGVCRSSDEISPYGMAAESIRVLARFPCGRSEF